MARRLTFLNDRDEEIALEIRSRRLFWVGFGQDTIPFAHGNSGTVLSHTETTEIAALFRALKELAKSEQISVRSEPPRYRAALD